MNRTIVKELYRTVGENGKDYYGKEELLVQGVFFVKYSGLSLIDREETGTALSVVLGNDLYAKEYYLYNGEELSPLQEQMMIKEILGQYRTNKIKEFKELVRALSVMGVDMEVQKYKEIVNNLKKIYQFYKGVPL